MPAACGKWQDKWSSQGVWPRWTIVPREVCGSESAVMETIDASQWPCEMSFYAERLDLGLICDDNISPHQNNDQNQW